MIEKDGCGKMRDRKGGSDLETVGERRGERGKKS